MGNRSYLELLSSADSSTATKSDTYFESNNFIPTAWFALLPETVVQAYGLQLQAEINALQDKHKDSPPDVDINNLIEEDLFENHAAWVITLPYTQALAQARQVIPSALGHFPKASPGLADFLMLLDDAARSFIQAGTQPMLVIHVGEYFGFFSGKTIQERAAAFVHSLTEQVYYPWTKPLNPTELADYFSYATWEPFDTWPLFGECSIKHYSDSCIAYFDKGHIQVQSHVESAAVAIHSEPTPTLEANTAAKKPNALEVFAVRHKNAATWILGALLGGGFLVFELTNFAWLAGLMIVVGAVLFWKYIQLDTTTVPTSEPSVAISTKRTEANWLKINHPPYRGEGDVKADMQGVYLSWYDKSTHKKTHKLILWQWISEINFDCDDGSQDACLLCRIDIKEHFNVLDDPDDTWTWLSFGPNDLPTRTVSTLQIMRVLYGSEPIAQAT